MNTNGEKLLLRDEVFQVVARAIEVLNGVGEGLSRSRMRTRSSSSSRCEMNYLQITGLHVGVIVNFKRRKLQWERIVL